MRMGSSEWMAALSASVAKFLAAEPGVTPDMTGTLCESFTGAPASLGEAVRDGRYTVHVVFRGRDAEVGFGRRENPTFDVSSDYEDGRFAAKLLNSDDPQHVAMMAERRARAVAAGSRTQAGNILGIPAPLRAVLGKVHDELAPLID